MNDISNYNPLINIDVEKALNVFNDIFPNGIKPFSSEEALGYIFSLNMSYRNKKSFKLRRFKSKNKKDKFTGNKYYILGKTFTVNNKKKEKILTEEDNAFFFKQLKKNLELLK